MDTETERKLSTNGLKNYEYSFHIFLKTFSMSKNFHLNKTKFRKKLLT